MQNDIYAELARLSAAGEEAALATVISASGSTPREEGAKMLVRPDGSIMGTIGGAPLSKPSSKRRWRSCARAGPGRWNTALARVASWA